MELLRAAPEGRVHEASPSITGLAPQHLLMALSESAQTDRKKKQVFRHFIVKGKLRKVAGRQIVGQSFRTWGQNAELLRGRNGRLEAIRKLQTETIQQRAKKTWKRALNFKKVPAAEVGLTCLGLVLVSFRISTRPAGLICSAHTRPPRWVHPHPHPHSAAAGF